MSDPLAERVITTLASVKHRPLEGISLDSSLEDLGLDSLDKLTVIFELEDAFEISIPDDQFRSIRSVADVVEGIRRLVATKAADD